MAGKKTAKNNRTIFLIGLGVLLFLGALVLLNLGGGKTTPPPAPTETPHPTWASLKAEAELASQHSIPAVREAAEKMLLLLNAKSVNWAACSGVSVYAEVHLLNERYHDIMIGILPQGTGTDAEGKPALLERILIDPIYWNALPQGDKWGFIWHEMLHVEQDCNILQAVLDERNLEGQSLWNEFHRRWEAAAAESEAYPLAVQAYWQQNGFPIKKFQLMDELLTKIPGAWSTPLPLDNRGVPIGIMNQPEWPNWVDMINTIYVVR